MLAGKPNQPLPSTPPKARLLLRLLVGQPRVAGALPVAQAVVVGELLHAVLEHLVQRGIGDGRRAILGDGGPANAGQTGGWRLGGRAGGGTGGGAALALRWAARTVRWTPITLLTSVRRCPGLASEARRTLAGVLRGSLARPVHTNQRPLTSPVLGPCAGELPVRRRRGGDLCDIALLLDTHSCLCCSSDAAGLFEAIESTSSRCSSLKSGADRTPIRRPAPGRPESAGWKGCAAQVLA